ncbi:MAG: TIR domain-containing protein [bacterium]
MAQQVFFSFHYDDVKTFRANVVRNHGFTKANGQEAGFFDASIWEDAKRHGDDSIKRLINSNLDGTTVTCALIGTETWSRRWVRYELLKSYDRGNALFGVHINSVPDKNRQTFLQGENPFDYLGFVVSGDGKKRTYYEHDGIKWKIYQDLPVKSTNYGRQYCGKGFTLSSWVKCYDWIDSNGYNNFGNWLENAK